MVFRRLEVFIALTVHGVRIKFIVFKAMDLVYY
jgi:hypothetical protein